MTGIGIIRMPRPLKYANGGLLGDFSKVQRNHSLDCWVSGAPVFSNHEGTKIFKPAHTDQTRTTNKFKVLSLT